MFRNIQCKCNSGRRRRCRETTNEIITIDSHKKKSETFTYHSHRTTRTRTFALTNETCNIKQFVNEHSFARQFDSHVKTSNLIWMNDKFHGEGRKKTMGQTESTASELVNAFYVGLFFPSSSSSFAFPWYFLWYPITITITSTLLNYTHLLSRSFAHTHINVMQIKYVLRVCLCFSVQNYCFVHPNDGARKNKFTTIKESL